MGEDGEASNVSVWLEKRLKIPPEFTAGLMSGGNDWMFIIKLHALVEAALNHVIAVRLGTPSLETIIARLETSNPKAGKIAFARRLGLLPPEAVTFIRYLSELRNTCAHFPSTYKFNLPNHIGKMNQSQQEAWLAKVNFKIVYPLQMKPGAADRRAEFLSDPRHALFSATLAVILYLHCEWVKADYEEWKDIVEWLQKKRSKPRFPEGFHEPSKPNPKEL